MARIVTVLAKCGSEYREVFNISKGKDESLYLESPLKSRGAHISIHETGKSHVTYENVFVHGKKLRIPLPNGQSLRNFKGCSSPNKWVIDRSLFNQMKMRDISNITSNTFVVDLAQTSLIEVTTYIFDPSNLCEFQNQVLKYANPQTKIVSSTLPYVGLIAHEPPS